MGFERKDEDVALLRVFLRRLTIYIGLSLGLISVALLIGIAGYHWIAGFDLVDSILNASMILAGMGPASPLATTAAKLFASAYAIFSGLVFITVMGLVLSPVFHRLLHIFHLEDDEESSRSG